MSDKATTEANIDALLPTNGLGEITAVDVADAIKEAVDFADTVQLTLNNITTDTTAVLTDQVVTVDDTAGDVTYTLLPAATAHERQITVKKIAGPNLTIIQADGSETIDGANTVTLTTQYESVTIYSTSTEWIIL